ncbi:centromere protein R isoform X5 [Rattus norvegicus]|uniref:centromere protein R isoform X5 n=1 Tax=Rattus norvegicus TaxID=10116 RepID=UPI002FD86E25
MPFRDYLCSQVKRSLKLDDQFEENSFGPSKIMRKKSITAFSPTTGTYQLSPFSSPRTPKEQEHRDGPSNGTRKWSVLSSPARQDSTVKGSDGFMMLLSKIERSSEKTMEIMKNLSSLQALEGNRQLEDLLGVSLVPCSLKSEAKKTKELMTKVMKQKLFEKKNSRIPPKGGCNKETTHRPSCCVLLESLSKKMGKETLEVGKEGNRRYFFS